MWGITASWLVEMASEWTQASMPVVASTSIVEIDSSRGTPALPVVATAPSAGPQSGEKTEAYSVAFKVSQATTVSIDSTLALNWSQQLQATSASDLGNAMMAAAVAAECDRQVGAAVIADADTAADLDAALAVFDDGRFLPSVLLVPPSALGMTIAGYSVSDLVGLGIQVKLAKLAQPVLLAPGAVTGWLTPLQAVAVEPKLLGVTKAYSLFGAVATDPAGAVVISA